MEPVKKLPDYGAVVVSYGSAPEVHTFVTSLEHTTHPPCFIVVVENSSEPFAHLSTTLPHAVLHLPHNPGYGSAINAGLASLPDNIPWILASNPDVVLEPEATALLLREATQHPNAGAIGPALINPDGTVYPSARAIPGVLMGIGHALLGWIWPTNPWTQAYRGTYVSDGPRASGWLSGACVLISEKAFTELGGFDESYFMFMEDVDLGMRLGRAGYDNIYVPAARAHHTVGHSTSKDRVAMAKAHHQSARRFVAQQFPRRSQWPIRIVVQLGLILRQLLVQVAHVVRPRKSS